MTYRPSSDTKQHRLQSADPVQIACALPFTARPKPADAQKRTALSGSPARLRPYQAFGSPSLAPRMQPLPRPPTHFPHRVIQAPRGFLLPRFVNAGRRLPAAHVAPRPASKNLQECGRSLHFTPMSATRSNFFISTAFVTRSFLASRGLLTTKRAIEAKMRRGGAPAN